jgi:hypothetical protein
VEGEDFSPLEVFYSYSNDALIEMKKVEAIHVRGRGYPCKR